MLGFTDVEVITEEKRWGLWIDDGSGSVEIRIKTLERERDRDGEREKEGSNNMGD